MANLKCCNKTMQKQEIHYGQNWLCLECGRELKTPANGMTQKDIDGYYAARSKFSAILIHEEAVRRGRAGGISGTGEAKKRGDSDHYKKMRAVREAKRTMCHYPKSTRQLICFTSKLKLVENHSETCTEGILS